MATCATVVTMGSKDFSYSTLGSRHAFHSPLFPVEGKIRGLYHAPTMSFITTHKELLPIMVGLGWSPWFNSLEGRTTYSKCIHSGNHSVTFYSSLPYPDFKEAKLEDIRAFVRAVQKFTPVKKFVEISMNNQDLKQISRSTQ
ncbi:hypothetical protein O6H91_06G087900 [Diphasiastrum complanatum]|uniref:Uncharacterized protein n=1 Tax=Diphasiastrum complanatum TaxID=34168 RepID=A0ACC2DFZ5_DIPCM|nr:hypothetical protein O6H91_06G087900 [Diphasiastrum complanatum]